MQELEIDACKDLIAALTTVPSSNDPETAIVQGRSTPATIPNEIINNAIAESNGPIKQNSAILPTKFNKEGKIISKENAGADLLAVLQTAQLPRRGRCSCYNKHQQVQRSQGLTHTATTTVIAREEGDAVHHLQSEFLQQGKHSRGLPAGRPRSSLNIGGVDASQTPQDKKFWNMIRTARCSLFGSRGDDIDLPTLNNHFGEKFYCLPAPNEALLTADSLMKSRLAETKYRLKESQSSCASGALSCVW